MDRFARQTILPRVGVEGADRIRASRVTVVGLGALGCPAADLLWRAGVGEIRLIDRDTVELTNLHRQTLFAEGDVGSSKAFAAAERLSAVRAGPVTPIARDLTCDSAADLFQDLDPERDVLVDCSDNFETRYLLNDIAVRADARLIYAGAIATHGTVLTVFPGRTPCLRCLFPDIPEPGSQPTCETAGVLGPASSAVGSLQAAQAIRAIVEPDHEPSLVQIDAWTLETRAVAVGEPDPGCVCCGRGSFEFLQGRESSETRVVCGRSAVHVDPARDLAIDLTELQRRLETVGRFEQRPGTLRGAMEDGTVVTVFADGRAVFDGTRDEARARTLYARLIG